MKKVAFVVFLSALFVNPVFAQVTTADAGLKVPSDRIRTGNEGFASEEFRSNCSV